LYGEAVSDDADPVSGYRRLAAEWAPTLHALGQPERLLIALCLSGGERTVSELQEATGLRQSLVSYHLAGLRSARLVTVTPAGRSNRYRLCCPDMDELAGALAALAGTLRQ
jgi:ArsR family transcriptional regulator